MTRTGGTSGGQSPELAHDAISFRESLAVGLGSTAPAYSLAAVIGTVTVIVGFQAPGALLAPLVGAAILGYLFVKSAIDFYDPENSYTGQSFLGMGIPFVIGMGALLVGLVLLVVWRAGGNERFFGRRPFESVDPEVAAGRS